MSSKTFTPIPFGTAGQAGGGFRPMPQFRSQLPVPGEDMHERWFPPLVIIPSVPVAQEISSSALPTSWPKPLAELPAAQQVAESSEPAMLPEIVLPPEPEPAAPQPVAIVKPAVPPAENPFKAVPDFNDQDLAEALAPMMEAAVRKAVYTSEKGKIDAFLEPMLRATVRRALAEYSPASRPFQAPGFIDRTVWRLQALFSSRTFEDVLFEKTHRFQVEEVYLLDVETLALVSFASTDPARHSTAKRVDASAKRIALQIRDESGTTLRSLERADGRNVISEQGKYMLLVAIVRGRPNELILADLEFSLRRIEDHFRDRFEQTGSALMDALQPFLEDCLLIQAPASAA